MAYSEFLLQQPHTLSLERVAGSLGVDLAIGLSGNEAKQRLEQYGPNRILVSKSVSDLTLILRQFISPIMILLMAAMVLSAALGEWWQVIAIAIVVVINISIGYFTERQAVRSMEALRELGTRSAKVRRDSRAHEVSADALVPGDIVLLEAGDVIPADLRCSSNTLLSVDESALTGESLPVNKDSAMNLSGAELPERSAMLFSGTNVVHGNGEGIVTATALSTEIGRIARLVEEAKKGVSPLAHQLALLSRQLLWMTLLLAGIIILGGFYSGKPVFLVIETAIALAVAAIPEGLPIVATIVLARGMLRMAQRNALVENLAAVETLGSTSLILTDKTGTLTENRMEVERIVTSSGVFSIDHRHATIRKNDVVVDPTKDPELMRALLIGVLCSNAEYDSSAQSGIGDPMEIALLRAGHVAGLHRKEQLGIFPEVAEHSFETTTKKMATVHSEEDGFFAAVKGAPEVILAATSRIGLAGAPLSESERSSWLERVEALASEGLRVIAVAFQPEMQPDQIVGRELVFLGLVAFRDPPRNDIAGAVSALRASGIRVVMATGDHPSTALSISRAIGMVEPGSSVITGAELPSFQELSEVERNRIAKEQIFARVTPEQKLDLIELFQRDGHIVAMTGDGINDAPALTKADIGIAMGLRGTQVAREAADIVLLDDAFSSIVVAVREGRIIFDNIRLFSVYLLSCNLAEVLVVGVSVFLYLPLPLLPLQILFLNLLTDVFPAFALAISKGEEDVLSRRPRPAAESILSSKQWHAIIFYGIIITISTLASIIAAQSGLGYTGAQLTTVSFLTIALSQLWHVFNMRSPESNFWQNAVSGNKFIWCSLAFCLSLILVAMNIPVLATVLQLVPIGWNAWLLVIGCSFVPLFVGQSWLVLNNGGSKSM